MNDALVFRDVEKRYGRRGRQALAGMSFRVPRGVVCGFVGPNGAGKTTTFSVCSGFVLPDAGEVDILGAGAFDPWTMKGRLGVLPQDAELPDRHTPVDLLTHLARLQGMTGSAAREEAKRQVAQVGLGDRADDRIGALSHGMRRRVAVASALLGNPELVLLDEPTAGLDPVQTRALREVLRHIRGAQTVVVSSHNLLELEQICDWVVMVDEGRCVRQGSVAEVTGTAEVVRIDLPPGTTALEDLASWGLDDRLVRQGDVLLGTGCADQSADEVTRLILAALAARGIVPHGLRRGSSLEDAFIADAEARPR